LNELKGAEFYFFDPKLEPDQVITNYFFNQPQHLFLQAKENWKIFGLKVNGKAVLQMAFYIKGGKAHSPFKAPFGSIQSVGRFTQKDLMFFLKCIEAFLKENEVSHEILIKNFPEAYHTSNTKLLYASLLRLGFEARTEISSIIKVDNKTFEGKIKISEKQKLLKCKSKFGFYQVSILKLPEIYLFIEACRRQKNQSLSMTQTELQETVEKFKNDFLLFEVKENVTRAAAAIVIRINKRILYTFYYAHESQFNKISPTVFLLSGIYSFAQENRYQIIDLGTSMNGNEINKPLLHFKESVGGQPSPKYIFEKQLE